LSRVLILYTGGTIACAGQPLAPMPVAQFAEALRTRGLLPPAAQCELRALDKALDSASMRPADWLQIARSLLEAWAHFDGFVVLHGTDSMAWTAAALSYLLPGIDKPVVLTGSQYPLGYEASDAARNFSDALAVAATAQLAEVVVCFAGQVLRGNRVIKRSAQALDAFVSPRCQPLAVVEAGVVRLEPQALLPVRSTDPALSARRPAQLAALAELEKGLADASVWVLSVHPGFPVAILQAAVNLPAPPAAWLLVCYGSGNAPQDEAFLAALAAAHARGIALLAISQCEHGRVEMMTYQAGSGLAAAGVAGGADLSLPAAQAKLVLLQARGLRAQALLQAMLQPLAGELVA
jgi:L-asparaginase